MKRDAPLRPGDSPGRLPGDRPVRFDDVYETDKERRQREFNEWNAKGANARKITAERIAFIRSPEGMKMKRIDLALMFGVEVGAITRARNGQTTGEGRGGRASSKRSLTDEQVRRIRALASDGNTIRDISEEFGGGRNGRARIRRVIDGTEYKDVT